MGAMPWVWGFPLHNSVAHPVNPGFIPSLLPFLPSAHEPCLSFSVFPTKTCAAASGIIVNAIWKKHQRNLHA